MSRRLDIRAVIAAHDFYRTLARQEPWLDFSGARVIARHLHVGTRLAKRCHSDSGKKRKKCDDLDKGCPVILEKSP